jgi:hypothetical protein
MVTDITRPHTPETRADLIVAAQGVGIYGVAVLMIQFHVPTALAIPAVLGLSAVSAYRWLGRRTRAVRFATVG